MRGTFRQTVDLEKRVVMKFGSKHIWNALFFLSGLVAIWVGACLTASLIMYFQFSKMVPGKAYEWNVCELSEDKYQIAATFSYTLDSKNYHAKYLFSKKSYPSKEAAEDYLEFAKKEEVAVWYVVPKGKAPIAILEKSLPIKEMIRFFFALFICLYFYFLRNYLYRFREANLPQNVGT